MRNSKFFIFYFCLNVFIPGFLFSNIAFTQESNDRANTLYNDTAGIKLFSKIMITPRIGINIEDKIWYRTLPSNFIGIELDISIYSDYLRLVYNHHFLNWFKAFALTETYHPLEFGPSYRDEIILSYYKKSSVRYFYLGYSLGFGYINQKLGLSPWTEEDNYIIPLSFEIGKEISEYLSIGIELKKSIFLLLKKFGNHPSPRLDFYGPWLLGLRLELRAI